MVWEMFGQKLVHMKGLSNDNFSCGVSLFFFFYNKSFASAENYSS